MNQTLAIFLTFILGMGIGGLGVHQYQAHQQKQDLQEEKFGSLYDKFFGDDFFQRSESPFKQMDRMRQEMDKLFPNTAFDRWYEDKFGGSISEIRQEEDEKFVYYKVGLKGLDKDTVKIDVRNSQVHISGEHKEIKAQEDKNSQFRSESIQSFRRSFPVPEGVDANKVEFQTTEDEITIKFPKTVEI